MSNLDLLAGNLQAGATDLGETPLRKIIHIDMDAFYASVEQRDDPTLRGRPVAVGSAQARGVVAAASYEARTFGVRSAMASVTALRRCPALVFVQPRFDVYRAVSQQIRAIFADYTDLIEPLSLDEAYLDVTEDRRGIGSATAIATEIRARIKADTRLTASAGVSYNKFIAKLASDQNKPDGLCVIRPAQGPAFVAALPVKRFHGVGPVTAAKMEGMGIRTGADLRDRSLDELTRHFGSSAGYFHRAAHGEDDRPVQPDRPLKSVGAERTFGTDLIDEAELVMALEPVIDAAWTRIARRRIGPDTDAQGQVRRFQAGGAIAHAGGAVVGPRPHRRDRPSPSAIAVSARSVHPPARPDAVGPWQRGGAG